MEEVTKVPRVLRVLNTKLGEVCDFVVKNIPGWRFQVTKSEVTDFA
jgi:hypothetical protein